MVDEDEPGVSVLLEGGTEESLPELLPPVGSVSPPVTKSSFRSGPSGVVEEELPEDPPEGVELPELDEFSELEELPVLEDPLELEEFPELDELLELDELPELDQLPELPELLEPPELFVLPEPEPPELLL